MAIGDIVANLAINSDPWKRGLSSAESSLSSFSSLVSGKVVGTIAAFAGAAVSVHALTSSYEELAGIADKAAQTGFGADSIRTLGFAADMSGTSAETLGNSLGKMTLNAAKAKDGGKEAAAAFEAVGLSVADLKTLSPEQQFSRIADGMQSITDPAARAAAAVGIFGKSGAELAPLLAQGSAGIADLMSQADMLGIGLSNEDIEAAAKADDAYVRLTSTIGGLIDRVAVSLAPAFTAATNAITAVIPSVNAFFGAVSTAVGGTADLVSTGMGFAVETIVTGFSIAEYTVSNFGTLAEFVFNEALLGVVSFGASVGHFFTAELPEYLRWFVDNWRDVFQTAFDFGATVFINLGSNIKNAWSDIVDYIMGRSEDLSLAWTPLMEGAVNTIKELPDIPDRAIGQLEASLAKKSKDLGEAVSLGLGQTIEKNMALIPKLNKAFEGPVIAAAGESPDPTTGGGNSKPTKMFAGAMEMGSTAAYSAIVQAMGSTGDSARLDKSNKLLSSIDSSLKKRGPEIVLVETI